jgi:hypothetical protein
MTGQGSPTNRPITACVDTNREIPIALLGQTQRALLNTSIQMTMPTLYTPTADAYHWGLTGDYDGNTNPGSLVSYVDPNGGQPPKFMMLMTDGAPTLHSHCNGRGDQNNPEDPAEIVQDVRNAAAAGIKTFVIGVPGSDDTDSPGSTGGHDQRPWLSLAAQVGGTAKDANCQNDGTGSGFCHMDMTSSGGVTDFSAALTAGLATVTSTVTASVGQMVSCDYPVPTTAPNGMAVDPNNVTIVVHTGSSTDATVLFQGDPASCTVGWYLSNGQVVLCPDSCAAAQGDLSTTIDVLFGCTSDTIIH